MITSWRMSDFESGIPHILFWSVALEGGNSLVHGGNPKNELGRLSGNAYCLSVIYKLASGKARANGPALTLCSTATEGSMISLIGPY